MTSRPGNSILLQPAMPAQQQKPSPVQQQMQRLARLAAEATQPPAAAAAAISLAESKPQGKPHRAATTSPNSSAQLNINLPSGAERHTTVQESNT